MIRTYALTALAVAGGLATMQAPADDFTGDSKDAWITGKIETVYALNRHLNGFTIDTDVDNGAVHLTGTVENAIDRDLAGEIAKGIEGVVSVDNDLTIREGLRAEVGSRDGGVDDPDRPFGVWVDDATTTAMVKSKLLGNANTKGLKIDVDTRSDVVTLTGEVKSPEEKELAEELARNTGDVREVVNRLVINRS
jgi:osmotically-inducible protein OsmY